MESHSATDLLVIVAHPDDEIFAAGLISEMSTVGKRVVVTTLTLGNAGRTLGICSQAELPQVREKEFMAALSVLGVTEAYAFSYPDFVVAADRGLAPHPGLEAVVFELIPQLASLIEKLMPETIITFPSNGLNGHPDHVATHHLVLDVLRTTYWQPKDLCYLATPRLYQEKPKPGFLAPQVLAELYLPPTHQVQVGPQLERKLRAMSCYETQALSILSILRQFPDSLAVEAFSRAILPEATTSRNETFVADPTRFNFPNSAGLSRSIFSSQ